MKISPYRSRWGDAWHFGPAIEWEDWGMFHHEFSIGFDFGPLIWRLQIGLWDWFDSVERKAIPVLMASGLSDSLEEARRVCDEMYQRLVDLHYNEGRKVNPRAALINLWKPFKNLGK